MILWCSECHGAGHGSGGGHEHNVALSPYKAQGTRQVFNEKPKGGQRVHPIFHALTVDHSYVLEGAVRPNRQVCMSGAHKNVSSCRLVQGSVA